MENNITIVNNQINEFDDFITGETYVCGTFNFAVISSSTFLRTGNKISSSRAVLHTVKYFFHKSRHFFFKLPMGDFRIQC